MSETQKFFFLSDFRWNFMDLCGLLLHYEAPLHVVNKLGMTPVQYATVRLKNGRAVHYVNTLLL